MSDSSDAQACSAATRVLTFARSYITLQSSESQPSASAASRGGPRPMLSQQLRQISRMCACCSSVAPRRDCIKNVSRWGCAAQAAQKWPRPRCSSKQSTHSRDWK